MFPYARAVTWIDETMLGSDQIPLATADANNPLPRYCWSERPVRYRRLLRMIEQTLSVVRFVPESKVAIHGSERRLSDPHNTIFRR